MAFTPAFLTIAILLPLLSCLLAVVLLTRALEAREEAYIQRCLRALRQRPRGVAVVTGATSGIGEHLAALLGGDCGMHVYLCHRSLARGEAARARILAQHPRARITLLELDVTQARSVRAAAALLRAAHARIDVLVANAGAMPVARLRWGAVARALLRCRLGAFLETGRPGAGAPHFMEGGASGSLMDVHALGHVLLVEALGPALAPGGRSRVVWSGSRAADEGAVDWAHLSRGRLAGGCGGVPACTLPQEPYAESKAVMELAARALAARSGVLGVCVCPGFVETPIAPPFFSAMSPLFRHVRALAPSMTLSLRRGCAAHLGALAEPWEALAAQPAAKFVLEGGGLGLAREGLVGRGMEEEALRVCQEWLAREEWAEPGGGGGAAALARRRSTVARM
jgi:NAD(P)-dependent dehydrogenase (short-subunit alcohol dehydrogenase family)